jgi:hypothetical protein
LAARRDRLPRRTGCREVAAVISSPSLKWTGETGHHYLFGNVNMTLSTPQLASSKTAFSNSQCGSG